MTLNSGKLCMAHFGVPQLRAFELGFFFIHDCSTMTAPLLPFDFWKLCLREDCVRWDKLLDFEVLGDECLRLLWESGALPCVLNVVQEPGELRLSPTARDPGIDNGLVMSYEFHAGS